MGRRHDELMERATAVPILRSDADRVLLGKNADGARVFALYLSDHPVMDRKTLESSDGAAYRRLAVLLRGEHVLLPWEPGRAAFLSNTPRAKDVEEALEAFEKVLPRLHQEELP